MTLVKRLIGICILLIPLMLPHDHSLDDTGLRQWPKWVMIFWMLLLMPAGFVLTFIPNGDGNPPGSGWGGHS